MYIINSMINRTIIQKKEKKLKHIDKRNIDMMHAGYLKFGNLRLVEEYIECSL
jgi:hypothetical protein